MTTKLFGTKVPRVEDQRFLRGQGRYVDDLLHARDLGAEQLGGHARSRWISLARSTDFTMFW